MDKQAQLLALAELRQASRYPGYKCIGDYHGGVYECEFVSPYKKTAGNVDAEIMVMLQDWSSDFRLSGPFDEDSAILGFSGRWPTSQNLIRLLRETFGLTLADIYATNLFPFVKPGKPGAKIRPEDLLRAAHEFGLPQIRIVNPKLVICLGMETFNALRQACDLNSCQSQASAIENPFNLSGPRTRIWCQAHTGYWGPINRNKIGRVSEDWKNMKEDFLERFGQMSLARVPIRSSANAYSADRDKVTPTSNATKAESKQLRPTALSASKRRMSQREGQKPCRVLAVSKAGEIICETPRLRSRPDLRRRIITNQRRALQKEYPSLAAMGDVVYKLEWLEGD